MLKVLKYEAKNKEEALNNCFEELNVKENDILLKEQEIEGGLFKAKKSSIEVIKKTDVIEFIKNYIVELSNNMGIDIMCETIEKNDVFFVSLVTTSSAIIIGKEGRTLNAIELLIKQSILSQTGFLIKINVDSSNYKNSKARNFQYEIKKIAKEVVRTKVEAQLDPMNSYERRLVHTIIGEFENLQSESAGEEPNRYVVIKYKES